MLRELVYAPAVCAFGSCAPFPLPYKHIWLYQRIYFLFSVWQIFMAVVWLILEVIMLFFYFDLPKVMSKNDDDLCVSTDNSVNNDSVVKGEKQKLRNINGSYRKLQRTNSVMDDWHLAKGWFTVCQWQAFS